MRNKRITRFLQILFFTLFTSLLFLSCGNLFSSVDDGESRAVYPSVRFVANMESQADIAIEARSAIPLLELSEADSVYYFVKASAEGKSDRLVYGLTPSLGIDLDSDTSWVIFCGIGKITNAGTSSEAIEDENIYMSSPQNPEPTYISPLSPVLSKSFALSPASGGSGYLYLKIQVASGIGITQENYHERICVDCSAITDFADKTVLSYNPSSNDFILQTQTDQSIPSGQYQFNIKFKNSSGIVLYETTQTVNIVNKMTTKKWVSDGQVINDSGVFEVTQTLIDRFLDTTLYVGIIPPLAGITTISAADTNSGTAYSPLQTLGAAISKIKESGSSSNDYHIYISGQLEENVIFSSALNSKAKSITIEGYSAPDNSGNPTDKILGLSVSRTVEGATLNIASSIPITIKKLWIKAKELPVSSNYTRGIYVSGQTDLLLDSLIISGFHTFDDDAFGAGIYIDNEEVWFRAVNTIIKDNMCKSSGGGLFLLGKGTKDDTIDNCQISANHAKAGAGIYISGAEVEITRTSITNNIADIDSNYDSGGGIEIGSSTYSDTMADVTLGSGCLIEGNKARLGGGVSICGATLTIDGAQIINNQAVNEKEESSTVDEGWGGGIEISQDGRLNIKRGLISGNTAQKAGGGIYIGCMADESYISITGGTIENNSALTRSGARGTGGAICSSGEVNSGETYSFYFGGSVYIPAGTSNTNDVYLGKVGLQSCLLLQSSLINHSASSPIVLAIDGDATLRGTALVKTSGIASLENYKQAFIIEDSEYKLKLSSDKQELRVDFPIYVKQNGTPSPDVATGKYDKPFASISDACNLITNFEVDYTIKIIGSVTGAQEIPSTAQAASITLQGASGDNSVDKIGSLTGAPVLTIKSTADVTIKDLQIHAADNTNGNGGDICSATANTLTLSNGTLLERSWVKKEGCGGAAVYKETGKLVMEDGAIIQNGLLSPTGDIVCHGAGIYLKKANFVMTGGKIEGNQNRTVGKGGGIYFDADGADVSIRISGGEITKNQAKYGAGIYMNGGKLYMSGGVIHQNARAMGQDNSCGGGIYVDGGANIYLYGKALIGRTDITSAPITLSSNVSNYADYGGGIYVEKGNVWLGYKDTNQPEDFEEVVEGVLGGIIGNYAYSQGGGIYLSKDYDNNCVYIADGQISFNGAKADVGLGGGIYVPESGVEKIIMYGGSLKGNGALHGGAIYTNTVLGCLNIGNDAFIQAMDGAGKNDIYLNNASDVITITSALNNHDTSKKINIRVNEASFGSGQTLVSAGFAMSNELLGAFQFFFENEDTQALTAANKKKIFINTPIYVAGTGYDSTITQAGVADGNGSSENPFNSLTAAFNLLTNPEAYYNIRVNGTITGTFELPSDKYAESVLLEGVQTTHNADGSPKDTIDGAQSSYSENGTTLKINTATKFTIKNLKVTGGKGINGGGVYVCSGATLVLDDDAHIVGNSANQSTYQGSGGGIYNEGTLIMKGGLINDNTASAFGGGVYSSGNVYIYGDTIIGDESKKNVIPENNEDYGNRAYYGGGIYCKDTTNNREIYLGYDENGEKAAWNGGIYHNLATYNYGESIGGGLYVYRFKLKMDSGTISGNKAQGISYEGNDNVYSEISGGLITKNKLNDTANFGAGLCFTRGDLEISGGKIKDNYITETGNGSDVLVYYNVWSYTRKSFAISGSASLGIVKLYKYHNTYGPEIIRVTGALEPPADAGGVTATILIYEYPTSLSSGFMHGDGLLQGYDGYTLTTQDAQKIQLSGEPWEIIKDASDSNLYVVDRPIYVSGTGHSTATGNGDDDLGDGSKTKPFASISRATQEMTIKDSPYTVYIDGTLQAQSITEDVDSQIGSTKPYQPGSIKLIGLNGLDAHGIPQDSIDAGGNCTALTVKGFVYPYLKISNLKITGGVSSADNPAGGIFVDKHPPLVSPGTDYATHLQLEDGVLITGNTATGSNSASGVYTTGPLNFFGGEISGNTGPHAVYMEQRYIYVKGSAYVPDQGEGCDVYLYRSHEEWDDYGKVRITGPLTKHTIDDKMKVTILPVDCRDDYQFLRNESSSQPGEVRAELPFECGKFYVGDGSSYGDFVVNGFGKLASSYIGSKVPGSSLDIGDVVFTDGSASPYTSVTSAQLASAVAVIFYKGTECSNDGKTRTLGVGLVQASGKSWCSGSAKGYGVSIDSTMCAPDQEAAGSATTFEDAVDRNGKDNYDQLDSALSSLSDGSDTYAGATKYPADYYTTMYYSVVPNVGSSPFNNDWYVPSAAELFQIYKNKTTVNAALSACGGTTFSGAYLTSSQHASNASMIMYLDFSGTSQIFYGVDKTQATKKTCAIHEF